MITIIDSPMFLNLILALQIVATTLICQAPQALAESRTTLDLNMACKYAVEHNYAITAMKHELQELQKKKDRTRAVFYPKVGLVSGVESDINTTSDEFTRIGYVYAELNLFNGWRDTSTVDLASHEVSRIELNLKALEFKVALEVEEQFHRYLYKKSLIELKDREVVLNDEHQSLVSQSRQMGSISETDVMEFQLKDAALKSELIALKQELDDTKSNLRRLLGDEVGGDFQPVGRLQHQHIKGTVNDYLGHVETKNHEIKIATLEYQVARTEKTIAQGGWLPKIDFAVKNGFLTSIEQIDPKKAQTSFTLLANWEIFSGGATRFENQEKSNAILKEEAQTKDGINTVLRKVETAFRYLKVTEARADLERNNVGFAKKYYQSVLAEYRRGFKNSSDLSQAAGQWQSAEARRTELEYEFIQRRIELEKLLGTRASIEINPKEH